MLRWISRLRQKNYEAEAEAEVEAKILVSGH